MSTALRVLLAERRTAIDFCRPANSLVRAWETTNAASQCSAELSELSYFLQTVAPWLLQLPLLAVALKKEILLPSRSAIASRLVCLWRYLEGISSLSLIGQLVQLAAQATTDQTAATAPPDTSGTRAAASGAAPNAALAKSSRPVVHGTPHTLGFVNLVGASSFEHVLSFLPSVDLGRCAATARIWNQTTANNRLWFRLAIKELQLTRQDDRRLSPATCELAP